MSLILPWAYASAVGAPFRKELDGLATKLKAVSERVAQLDERRRFDPLAAVVYDGKAAELAELTAVVQRMRSDAAVKAWARVAALTQDAAEAAAREYAAARRLAEEAKEREAAQPPKQRRTQTRAGAK